TTRAGLTAEGDQAISPPAPDHPVLGRPAHASKRALRTVVVRPRLSRPRSAGPWADRRSGPPDGAGIDGGDTTPAAGRGRDRPARPPGGIPAALRPHSPDEVGGRGGRHDRPGRAIEGPPAPVRRPAAGRDRPAAAVHFWDGPAP